jgi:L-ornithine Nalpha-acyltransferase
MLALCKGRYTARLARSQDDVVRAQMLRHVSFRQNRGRAGRPDGRDVDDFDAISLHMLVEDMQSGALVCCFRLLPFRRGAEIMASYSAQYYDLAALSGFDRPLAEVGRFCIHPDSKDPDILRMAWGALTRYVDAEGIEMLFGCSSFDGADADLHRRALATLGSAFLAPPHWSPREKSPEVVRYASERGGQGDTTALPPLLRTYLMMGGWISDHAVIDRDLDTIHVFTALEIQSIPPARARLLRAIAS